MSTSYMVTIDGDIGDNYKSFHRSVYSLDHVNNCINKKKLLGKYREINMEYQKQK